MCDLTHYQPYLQGSRVLVDRELSVRDKKALNERAARVSLRLYFQLGTE